MLIKFKSTDPRAGQVVRMDSHRGQELIDTGAAVAVKEDGSDEAAAPAPTAAASPASTSAPAPAAAKTVRARAAR